jgi:hypothetical protein
MSTHVNYWYAKGELKLLPCAVFFLSERNIKIRALLLSSAVLLASKAKLLPPRNKNQN